MADSAQKIHPTAVVDPKAELGADVEIGSHVVVEAGAVIGRGTKVLANAVVTGFATIGEDCELHYGAIVGHTPQDLSFTGVPSRVIVGDRTIIREYATIHRATAEGAATQIGTDSLLMGGAHVAHDCRIGDRVIICNSALVAGHSEIGDRAFISGNTVIHQFCRIGPLVMLSGISGVNGDVGPYLMVRGRSEVCGINVVGLRRAQFDAEALRRVKEAYRRLFNAKSLEQGLAEIEGMAAEFADIACIRDFYQQSRRGFSRPAPGRWR